MNTNAKFAAKTVLATFASKSNPGHRHEVRVGADGNIYCTCPAWRFQHNHPMNRVCKHTKAVVGSMVHGGRTMAAQDLPEPTPVRPRRQAARSRTAWERF